VLSELTPDDVGGGPIILYPTRSASFGRPLLRHPIGELIWQFDILRTALPTGTPAHTLIDANRRLYEHVREIGGYLYPVGAVPISPDDWDTPLRRQLAGARSREATVRPGEDPDAGPPRLWVMHYFA
jgi:hypothetical protein